MRTTAVPAGTGRVKVCGLLFGGSLIALASSVQAQTGPASGTPDPYKDYSTLDSYLGGDFLTRFYNYYKLEWGKAGPTADLNAPPSARPGWPTTPQTTP